MKVATLLAASVVLLGESETVKSAVASGVEPLLGDGSSVDWWFAYKFAWTSDTKHCSNFATRECIFGGNTTASKYFYESAQDFVQASGSNGKTTPFSYHGDCIGMGNDPVAETFELIFNGTAPNALLWNDQFYGSPAIPCESGGKECSAPWGHSKGAIAWDEQGNGFIMQVTTPDWPGSVGEGSPPRAEGNTLGCTVDNNVMMAQHFFSLRLSPQDTKTMLQAMSIANVATDPTNPMIARFGAGPAELRNLAMQLGSLTQGTKPLLQDLSVKTSSGNPIRILAKPSNLQVPVYQMVGALLDAPLKVASFWNVNDTNRGIPSMPAGTPGCWDPSLPSVAPQVVNAVSGTYNGQPITLYDSGLHNSSAFGGNHAKIAHSTDKTLVILGDMNQDGTYNPNTASTNPCGSSQNGRGGLFFILDDAQLHQDIANLFTGYESPIGYNSPQYRPDSPLFL